MYLSFPISGSRQRLAEGDDSGIQETNGFLQRAYAFAKNNRSAAFFCPLSIDELPLARHPALAELQAKEQREANIESSASQRWEVAALYDERLLVDTPIPQTITFRAGEVLDAAPSVEMDVRIRDYRIIDQSKALVVFNPAFRTDRQRDPNLEKRPDRRRTKRD